MRYSLLASLLMSVSAFAQLDVGNGVTACTHLTPGFTAGGNFECATLTIPVGATFTFNSGAQALVIKVKGLVTIDGVFDVKGVDGSNQGALSGASLVRGGPGAGDGGNDDGSSAQNDAFDYQYPTSLSRGGASQGSGICGSGGGGGGFFQSEAPPALCGGAVPPGIPGQAVSSGEFDFTTALFRGGFGGGPGGYNSTTYGTGGGGGGGIRIIAGGDIIINATGMIDARGGSGGSGGNVDGGGGGAGSGGAIWLQSLGNIINDGSLDTDGGTGGTITAPGTGSAGGNGSMGFIRLEDLDGVIGGTGSTVGDISQFPVNLGGGGNSLSSSIACGKVSEKNNQTMLLQILAGFLLAFGLVAFINKLKFLTQSKT